MGQSRERQRRGLLSLLEDLLGFDGKSVAVLRDIRAGRSATPELLDALIGLTGDGATNVQVGASWLLRAYLRDGATLSPEQVGRLAEVLPLELDGFARLHLCQAVDHITIPERDTSEFADFFRESRRAGNTFLRAWAPHAFMQMARQHETYADEARALVEEALSDPAPSVRARARKTLESM